MRDDRPEQRRFSGFALPASIGLHLALAALLAVGLPRALQPQDDQPIDVALVPPPEPGREPPAAERQDTPAQPPPDANAAPAPQSRVSSFDPVVRYGERDSGPDKSLEGDSAEEEAAPAQEAPDDQTETEEKDETTEDDAETELALPDSAALPTAKPTETAEKPVAAKLRQAKKLFSPAATGDALATTAMAGLPRSLRGGTLCVSELREQLLRNAPPYFADLLPSSPLGNGNVIDVPDVAFRADGQWRDLSYRCEVDEDATRVVSFAFRIGGPIPRGEWQRRGLPSR